MKILETVFARWVRRRPTKAEVTDNDSAPVQGPPRYRTGDLVAAFASGGLRLQIPATMATEERVTSQLFAAPATTEDQPDPKDGADSKGAATFVEL